jgi:hypothetical protein
LSTSLVQKDPKNAYFQIKVLALIIWRKKIYSSSEKIFGKKTG